MWSTIGEGLLGIVKGIFDHQAKVAEAKTQLKIAKFESRARIEEAKAQAAITMAQKAQDHEHEWERIMASMTEKSWKDEYILLLFSVPLWMSFIPPLAPFVSAGFAELEVAPDWYLQVVLAGAAVAYGLRNLTKLPFRK